MDGAPGCRRSRATAICTCFVQVAGTLSPQSASAIRSGESDRPTSSTSAVSTARSRGLTGPPSMTSVPRTSRLMVLIVLACRGASTTTGRTDTGRIPHSTPTDTAARHAHPMNTMHTTNTTRLARSTAAAALVAAALVGCAAQASAPVDPLDGPVGALEPRRPVRTTSTHAACTGLCRTVTADRELNGCNGCR